MSEKKGPAGFSGAAQVKLLRDSDRDAALKGWTTRNEQPLRAGPRETSRPEALGYGVDFFSGNSVTLIMLAGFRYCFAAAWIIAGVSFL